MSRLQAQANLTAFGALDVAEINPTVAVQFSYNINPGLFKNRGSQSGSVTIVNNMGSMQSGTAANSSGELLTNATHAYHPGQGALWRGTGVYTTGVTGNTQLLGIGDTSDGFFFGFDGPDFGLLVRRAGQIEIRTMTVTTASTTGEDITITLDGDTATDVTVTNSNDVTVTANEIADHNYKSVGRGWDASAVGDTVVFLSWYAGAQTGTYSLSSASTAVGSFAQTVAGAAPTDTWTKQADWNHDSLDGTANSEVDFVLDPTKGNVFDINFQWLGFGNIIFSIENPETGRFVTVHEVHYSNTNTVPSIQNPTLPAYASSINTTNTSNITLNVGSMMAANEGSVHPTGLFAGAENKVTISGTAETPVISIRNNEVYQSKSNRIQMKVELVTVSVEHTKPCIVRFYAAPTLVGTSWSDYNAAISPLQVDKSATSHTGGFLLLAVTLGKTGSTIIDLNREHQGPLRVGTHFTATAEPFSGNGAEVTVCFNTFAQH